METIYNLVPEVVVERPKPPMYRSKHDPKAPLAGSTFGIGVPHSFLALEKL